MKTSKLAKIFFYFIFRHFGSKICEISVKFSLKMSDQISSKSSHYGPTYQNLLYRTGVGKKGRVKSNPHSKIDPIMSGH
jgi:hypothetical protein